MPKVSSKPLVPLTKGHQVHVIRDGLDERVDLEQAINGLTQQSFVVDTVLLTDDEMVPILTNYAAPGSVTITLRPATVGAYFDAAKLVDQRFLLRPYGSETFINGTAGGALEMLELGFLQGVCLVAGQWIPSSGLLFTLE